MKKKVSFIDHLRGLRPEVNSLVAPWKDIGISKQTWHNIMRGACPQGEIAESIRLYFDLTEREMYVCMTGGGKLPIPPLCAGEGG